MDLRALILFHLVRFGVGVGFLLMYRAGDLPGEFAVKAGWGDIVVGAAAIVAALFVPAITTLRVRAILVWNTAGLADILMVFAIAQRLIFSGDGSNALIELTRFPLLIVPTFVVPLIIITHFLIFARFWRMRTS